MENVIRVSVSEGIDLTLIKTDKFKSNLMSIYIQRKLDEKEASMNAILPEVLADGCRKYPSMKDIADRLDELYGAAMAANTTKNGERQIISFKLINISERYADEDITSESIDFLKNLILDPLVEDGGFKKEYVSLEKENLKNRIKAEINDKRSYAHKRCIKIMCEDERYSIPSTGTIEDVEAITPENLYNHYKKVINESKVDIVIEGDFDTDKMQEKVKNAFSMGRNYNQSLEREEFIKHPEKVKRVVEKMDITQGKLVMGYRTNIDYMDKKYYAFAAGCNVLGGGPHSKLFTNVREKESLCYYVFPTVEKYKGIMLISAGIEFENFEKTERLIKENLESVKKGEISEKELTNTKKALINGLRAGCDGIGGLSEFVYSQIFGNTSNTLDGIIEAIENVTVEDIVDAMKGIEEDTVYFLRNNEGEEN